MRSNWKGRYKARNKQINSLKIKENLSLPLIKFKNYAKDQILYYLRIDDPFLPYYCATSKDHEFC
jgi:hypothetical protein